MQCARRTYRRQIRAIEKRGHRHRRRAPGPPPPPPRFWVPALGMRAASRKDGKENGALRMTRFWWTRAARLRLVDVPVVFIDRRDPNASAHLFSARGRRRTPHTCAYNTRNVRFRIARTDTRRLRSCKRTNEYVDGHVCPVRVLAMPPPLGNYRVNKPLRSASTITTFFDVAFGIRARGKKRFWARLKRIQRQRDSIEDFVLDVVDELNSQCRCDLRLQILF